MGWAGGSVRPAACGSQSGNSRAGAVGSRSILVAGSPLPWPRHGTHTRRSREGYAMAARYPRRCSATRPQSATCPTAAPAILPRRASSSGSAPAYTPHEHRRPGAACRRRGHEATNGAAGSQVSARVREESRSSPSSSTRLHARQPSTASGESGTSRSVRNARIHPYSPHCRDRTSPGPQGRRRPTSVRAARRSAKMPG